MRLRPFEVRCREGDSDIMADDGRRSQVNEDVNGTACTGPSRPAPGFMEGV